MAKMNKNLRLITRTALLLAVTLLFQELREVLPGTGTIVSTLIIGSLVNLGLLVSAAIVGWRGSILISIATPIVALIQGHITIPVLIPIVAAGNIILVLTFELLCRKLGCGQGRQWIALGTAAVLKTVFLWAAVTRFFVLLILPGMEGYPPAAVEKISQTLSLNFSWPQLVTALIGGIVALAVIRGVKRALREDIPETAQ